ncbi:hypothetical protein E3J84_05205, partial [Candidatus Aerophobetes bacterium]
AKASKTSDLDITKASDRIQEYSWEHELIWEYVPPGNAHHDVQRLDNGNTLLLYMEVVPEEYKKKIKNLKRRRDACVYSDVVLELTPDKEIVWEWHEYKYLDINQYCQICNLADWTHTNTVQALPENKWYDAGDKRFKPGNILLSLRNLSVIFVVDKESKEVVWTYTGDYNGGLAGQHEPHMIEKGLPGEGNILIFDNGAPPLKNLRHCGQSYVLEINPVSKNLVWRYENGEKFFSKFRSNMQRLPNGNTLICESEGPRSFEVTSEKEIVWEYAVPYQLIIGRAYRYPYDYCPQLRALGKPKEKMVSPPSHVSTKPIALRF